MKIIGLDPGYARVGWGIIENEGSKLVVLNYGTIETKSKLNFPKRLEIIFSEINEILRTYRPGEMAIEKLFFQVNRKTAIDVAQARGVVLLAAELSNLSIFEYSPLQVKQGISGYGMATKQQIMQMCVRILNLKEIPTPDDAADALAIAVAHSHSRVSKISKVLV